MSSSTSHPFPSKDKGRHQSKQIGYCVQVWFRVGPNVFWKLWKALKRNQRQKLKKSSVEKLIGEAYSVIDKAVKAGTLHRNTGANRKSRLARRK
ncbi:hypothetical protein Lal_00028894 [Lupinus albus]|nr:hypothetical protein Lal_00028894 [Lupinus albus]